MDFLLRQHLSIHDTANKQKHGTKTISHHRLPLQNNRPTIDHSNALINNRKSLKKKSLQNKKKVYDSYNSVGVTNLMKNQIIVFDLCKTLSPGQHSFIHINIHTRVLHTQKGVQESSYSDIITKCFKLNRSQQVQNRFHAVTNHIFSLWSCEQHP